MMADARLPPMVPKMILSRPIQAFQNELSEWPVWMTRTVLVGTVTYFMPMPPTVTIPMRLHILAAALMTLAFRDVRSTETGRCIDKIGDGLIKIGKGLNNIALGISVGLGSIAISIIISSNWYFPRS